jgi:tetratricopeptide (TPR) repeat protein
MRIVQRVLARTRIRAARSRVAEQPTAKHYLALASEYALLGELDLVQRVCTEALELHPDDPELVRMRERALALRVEERTRDLVRELREAPRPGLYRELFELHLIAGRVERAEECAAEWFAATQDPDAQVARGRARLQRFLSDRRREDGRVASEALEQAVKLAPRQPEALRALLTLYSAVGAWRDARRTVSRLLEVEPGDPALEARFRTLNALAESAPAFDAALREVERTGVLADDEPSADSSSAPPALRPLLKALAATPGVRAAVFERGATALVQGPKGATAERTARAVGEVLSKSRTAARRLGLGHAREVELEGAFGSLLIESSERGAAAVWCAGALAPEHRSALLALFGAGGEPRAEEERP